MFGLHRSLPLFQAPPCICTEIEGRVREAIAMRDEMAKWDTPLREWAKLQEMPVLRLKSEPKPEPKPMPELPKPAPLFDFGYMHATLSTQTVHSIVRAPTPAVTFRPSRPKVRTFPAADGRRATPAPDITPYAGVIYDGVPSSIGLEPSEALVQRGDILNRGNGRYQVVGLEYSMGTLRAMVVKLRD